MRQAVWLVVGLILAGLGATGAIRLVINKDPGAMRLLPGGFIVQLAAWIVVVVVGLRLARHNRVRPDLDRH